MYRDGNQATPDSIRIVTGKGLTEMYDVWFQPADAECASHNGHLWFSDIFSDIDGAGGDGHYIVMVRAVKSYADSAYYTDYYYSFTVNADSSFTNDTTLTTAVETIETEVGVIDGNVDDVETLANTIDGKVDVVDGNVDDVETLANTIDGKVDVIDTEVEVIDTEVGVIDNEIAVVDGNVDDIETLVTTIDSEVGVVDGNVDDIETAVNALNDFNPATEYVMADSLHEDAILNLLNYLITDWGDSTAEKVGRMLHDAGNTELWATLDTLGVMLAINQLSDGYYFRTQYSNDLDTIWVCTGTDTLGWWGYYHPSGSGGDAPDSVKWTDF